MKANLEQRGGTLEVRGVRYSLGPWWPLFLLQQNRGRVGQPSGCPSLGPAHWTVLPLKPASAAGQRETKKWLFSAIGTNPREADSKNVQNLKSYVERQLSPLPIVGNSLFVTVLYFCICCLLPACLSNFLL